MGERKPIDPAEFTRRVDEGNEGAGPNAPETDNPRTGRPGAGGHGPKGPGGAGPERADAPEPRPPHGDERT
jgi:hypothetical protein